MAKAKMYGLKRTNPRLQVDLRWQKKQHQRNRERPQRVQIKKKEAAEDGV